MKFLTTRNQEENQLHQSNSFSSCLPTFLNQQSLFFSFFFTDPVSLTSVLPECGQQTKAPMLHHKPKQEHQSPSNVLHLNTREHNVGLYKDNNNSIQYQRTLRQLEKDIVNTLFYHFLVINHHHLQQLLLEVYSNFQLFKFHKCLFLGGTPKI